MYVVASHRRARPLRALDPHGVVDTPLMIDVVMVQCWLFGLELCAGASLERLCELLDAEWPESYRPRATA